MPVVIVHIAEIVTATAIIGGGTWLIRDLRRRHEAEAARDVILGQIVHLFTGSVADPVTGDAETPEEIAISVLAEMIRVRRRVARPPLPMGLHGR